MVRQAKEIASDKYIVVAWHTVTGRHAHASCKTQLQCHDWATKAMGRLHTKRFKDATSFEIFASLRSIRTRLREGFTWDERGLASALHHILQLKTGKEYPLPHVQHTQYERYIKPNY